MSEKGGISFGKGCLWIVLIMVIGMFGMCVMAVAVPNFKQAQERAEIAKSGPVPVSDIAGAVFH